MNLNTPLHVFLTQEKASVRLYNMLTARFQPGKPVPTLAQFIAEWPLARLKKEVFGFGRVAQAELHEILCRHWGVSGRRFATYADSLRPPIKVGPSGTDRTCVYCGCTDSQACRGRCFWIVTFQFGNAGVCSNCIEPHQPLAATMAKIKTSIVNRRKK